MRLKMQMGSRKARIISEIVIGVMATLIILPKVAGRCESSPVTGAKTKIENLSSALDAFENDTHRYPTIDEGLSALFTNPRIENWKGPYLRGAIPNDPWGNPYQYRLHEEDRKAPYHLASYGPDGLPDTNDDVTNLLSGESWR